MDLFSGSFGCFKPVRKEAKADLESEQTTKEKLKIWVVRCSRTGSIHYVEAYKDFVDVLFGFLMLRTGALIRLNREVSPAMTEAKTGSGGIYGVYDSFKRLDDSVVLVDREILLDPYERLKVSQELQALDSGDFECCNADCFKYLSGSRQICRSCTTATHFSCVTCGGYFRENAHTSLCYTPWRPWRNHMTAAPILTRYTVIQSRHPKEDKPKKEGYVRSNIPFIITNELIITTLSTTSLSEVLKTCGARSCEDLECNELSIGTQEVLVMLGAALTSPTPLTDIFGSMCNQKTRVSSSGSGALFSQSPPSEKKSKCGDHGGSSIKRSTSSACSTAPNCEKVSKIDSTHDSPIRRPASVPCFTLNPCQKRSKSQDLYDSSTKRPTPITTSASPPPPYESTSRSHGCDDSLTRRPITSSTSKPATPCESPSRSHTLDDLSIRRPKTTPCFTLNPCQKWSKPQDRDSSSFRRPIISSSSSPPSPEKRPSRSHNRDDPSIRSPTITPCFTLNPCQKRSKPQDHDDSSIRRPITTSASSPPPPYKSPSRSRNCDDILIRRPMPTPYLTLNPCQKSSTPQDHNDSEMRRPISPTENTSRSLDHYDSSTRRPKTVPCLTLSPCQKRSKPQDDDDDDSSMRRPITSAASPPPPYENTSRSHDSLTRRLKAVPCLTLNPCQTRSKLQHHDDSSIRRLVTSSDHYDSSKRRPTTFPCLKLNPCQKRSKPQEHDDDSLMRRPITSSSSSTSPPCENPSRFLDHDDPSISRWTSIDNRAMLNKNYFPDQSPRQSPRQSPLRQLVQDERAVGTQTESKPCRSSFTREGQPKPKPRKISFQPAVYEEPDQQPNCFGYVPSHPRSPQAIASESSFIQLSNFENTSQQSLLSQQHPARKSSCTPSGTPDSQSMEHIAYPIRREHTATNQILQQTQLTRRPICSHDCAQGSSPSPPLGSNSKSILNPLFQKDSASKTRSFWKSAQPPSQAPSIHPPSLVTATPPTLHMIG
ncbi:unnamed protein product [Calypogeia fissa]